MTLPSRWLRPFSFLFRKRETLTQRLDSRLPDLSGIGPVLFDAHGLRKGFLSAHQRLQTAEIPAIIAELLGPKGHLAVAPDGVVAWRCPDTFVCGGDMVHLELYAYQELQNWRPGERIPVLALDAAFRVRGQAQSLLGDIKKTMTEHFSP
jgi:hypothetical protein